MAVERQRRAGVLIRFLHWRLRHVEHLHLRPDYSLRSESQEMAAERDAREHHG